MDRAVFEALSERVEKEPYAQKLGIELVELERGRALTRMVFSKDLENALGMAHGGAIFSLIDVAFGSAANSHGTVAVALNVNITYVRPPSAGDTLYAEAVEVNRSNRISTCCIRAFNQEEDLIAVCQATAYRKKDPLPFL